MNSKAHAVRIVIESSTGGVLHQRITVEEGADVPAELIWKYRSIVGGILTSFNDMADRAVAGGEVPWGR